jgi:hypothetical protein
VPNKVPERLQQFSAEFLGNGKSGQVLRERTLDTKRLGEATIRAKPALFMLNRILASRSADRSATYPDDAREARDHQSALLCFAALRHRIGALDKTGVQT